ncbi:MAG: sodium:solute symporter [Cyanobium sp. 49614_E6]|nr:sodium:solute symporter [Cyanobium sp. 49614_E6]
MPLLERTETGPLLAALAQPLLPLALLAALLVVGRWIGQGIQMKRLGLPESLLAGGLGLLLAPGGPLPVLPPTVVSFWAELPLALLTLVFGSLLVAKPLPKPGPLWRPLRAQILLALVLAFGQFLVGALVVGLVLQPWLGVSPVMACLIEVAFEGGHGSAAAMGPTYERLGLVGGQDLGLAMATVGLLTASLVGGLLVVWGRWRGWLATPHLGEAQLAETKPVLAAQEKPGESLGKGPPPADAAPSSPAPPLAAKPGPWAAVARWLVNLGLAGVAVALGWGGQLLLGLAANRLGGGVAVLVSVLPVFPLALLASLLVRWVLEQWNLTDWASAPVQQRIGTLAADLLIVAATASLNLGLLTRSWEPLLVLSLAGLAWNLGVVVLLGQRLMPAPWFERSLVEFGQATGVVASGLLLLQMAEAEGRAEVLTPFSIKQLLLQPLLAGGLITVAAPLAVHSWGLPAWGGLCLAVVLGAGGLGLWLARVEV